MTANVVIVGTGAFAITHADALSRQSRLRLHGFVGSEPTSSAHLAGKYGVQAYEHLDEALSDNAVQALIVATPHATHHAIGMAALAAQKHVLIEKPLATSVAECDALIAADRQSSARAMVGHLMRWAPAHQQARKLLEDGLIGEIVAVDSRRVIDWGANSRRPWQKSADEGGGMWMIQGVHVIDQMTYLVGARAETAFGIAATRFHRDQSADDFGVAHLTFGEVQGRVMVAGTHGLAPQVYTELVGTRGQMRVSHRGELIVERGEGWHDYLTPGFDHWHDMIDAEISAFAGCIYGADVPVDLDYGRYVVATVEATLRSQLSGKQEAVL